MADYSDHYKDQKRTEFLRRWEPDGGWPESYDDTHKWLSARARSAEETLKEVKRALGTLESFREHGHDRG